MSLLDEGIQYHLKITAEDVGRYVILPGDPGRVPKIAARLDNVEHIIGNREFVTYTGRLEGVPVSVVSTGIGGPSAAIAIEELIRCGCDTFIRVGTSGGMNLKVAGGDLVVANAAIRGDGASREYLTLDYPAVADFAVTTALVDSAKELSTNEEGNSYHVGVVQSKDSFYGEIEPETMPVSDFLMHRWDAYIKCGCLASEMESASIYAVALSRGVRAGAVLTVLWNIERSKKGMPDNKCESSERAIDCVIGAIKRLIKTDVQPPADG